MENKSKRIFSADRLFTGAQWLDDHSVVIEGEKICAVVPTRTISGPPDEKVHLLAPAFIDIQIYGAHGKLFSVFPGTDSLHRLYDYCAKGGASHFQPTVATNSKAVFYQCIDAVRAYWLEGGKGCLGLHLEGPWINPSKKGAHIESFIHSPSAKEVNELLAYGKGVITMITLAPEMCSREVVELVHSAGVVISAGHSNASYGEARDAFNGGIPAATHLFNAMSPLQHRAPGLAGAVLDHGSVMASIIPDGYHVDYSVIRIAKKSMGERLFVITDAVTETSEGPYQHYLAGEKYEAHGILSGSALDMAKALRNLVHRVGIEPGEALRMLGLYPARVMRQANRLGMIEAGYDASMVMLDGSFEVKGLVTA